MPMSITTTFGSSSRTCSIASSPEDATPTTSSSGSADEDHPDPLPDDVVVVDDQHLHRAVHDSPHSPSGPATPHEQRDLRPRYACPRPGDRVDVERTRRRSRLARACPSARRPRRSALAPRPPTTSKPTPSSATSTCSVSVRRRRTHAPSRSTACACRTTLLTASCTMRNAATSTWSGSRPSLLALERDRDRPTGRSSARRTSGAPASTRARRAAPGRSSNSIVSRLRAASSASAFTASIRARAASSTGRLRLQQVDVHHQRRQRPGSVSSCSSREIRRRSSSWAVSVLRSRPCRLSSFCCRRLQELGVVDRDADEARRATREGRAR